MTPVSRTLAYLTELGILAGRVDRRVGPVDMDWPGNKVGFADVLAILPTGPLFIQVTSHSNHAARVRKIKEQSAHVVRTCLRCGCTVEVWSWKRDEDEPRVEAITVESLS